jgi:hypothetical protein
MLPHPQVTVDKKRRFYITSALGVQIFDPHGRPWRIA